MRGRIDGIDGLRAVAALSVFVFHVVNRAPELHDLVGGLTGHLDTGVEVFFVLSGFLIFGPFAKAIASRGSRPDLRGYVVRRVARLWPAYGVALAVTSILGATALDGGIGAWAKHLSLTFTYFEDHGGLGLHIAWSLVVEVSFYAAVPLLALAMFRSARSVVSWCSMLIVLGAVSRAIVALALVETPMWFRILPPSFLTLGLGMLFVAVHHEPAHPVARAVLGAAARPGRPVALAVAAFGVLVLAVPAGPLGGPGADRVLKELLQAIVAGGLALPVLVPSEGVRSHWRAVVAWRGAVSLGVVSYGFYLWQVPVLRLVRDQLVSDALPEVLLGVTVGFALSVGVATLSWFAVERPMLALAARARLSSRRPSTRSAA